MKISIKDELDKQRRRLTLIERQQMPFGTALGLTRLAKKATEMVWDEIPKRFILRKKRWVKAKKKGIRFMIATKDKPWAAVYGPGFLAPHETGGTKKPKGKALAIPMGIRSNPRQSIGKAKQPEALLGKPGYFVALIPPTDRRLGLFKDMKRKEPKLLYLFAPKARIRPRLGFRETVDNARRKHAKRIIAEAIQYALDTAK